MQHAPLQHLYQPLLITTGVTKANGLCLPDISVRWQMGTMMCPLPSLSLTPMCAAADCKS